MILLLVVLLPTTISTDLVPNICSPLQCLSASPMTTYLMVVLNSFCGCSLPLISILIGSTIMLLLMLLRDIHVSGSLPVFVL